MSIAATRFGHTEGRVGLAYGKDGEKVRLLHCFVQLRISARLSQGTNRFLLDLRRKRRFVATKWLQIDTNS